MKKAARSAAFLCLSAEKKTVRRKKTPTGSPEGVFSHNKPDDNLLSHWLQHYHRRKVVSRS
ncbi:MULTISPECIES: hypothetical protein, partial [unclassified Janthinobacterium]|uniref:hypothetical protein n=1 Tax=unclassified Janthinobacterium TaxID=2610881 RepID=UPI0025B208D4